MKRTIVYLFLMLLSSTAMLAQSKEKADTTVTDTTMKGVKMHEVVVTKDRRLPIFPSKEKANQPRVPSLSDIIGRKATDMIMHPFAIKQRKEERRRRKAWKKLQEFSQVKTNDELLREALRREGIDPDSLLQVYQKEMKEKK